MAQLTNWWHSWGEIVFLVADVAAIAVTMILSKFASRKVWWWLVPMAVLTALVIPDLLVRDTPDPVWVVISFVSSVSALLVFISYLIFGREREVRGSVDIGGPPLYGPMGYDSTQRITYKDDSTDTKTEQGGAPTVFDADERDGDKTKLIRRVTPAFAWLVGIGGKSEGKRFDVSDGITTIGRSPANTVVLDCDSVSKEHAKIRYLKDEDVFKVYDLVSTNGTFVEGVRVEGPVALQDGSKIEFGEEPLVFKRVSIRPTKRASEQP